MKRALITGINGQDGPYLARLLSAKNYHILGLSRKKISQDSQAFTRLQNINQLELKEQDYHCQAAINKMLKDFAPDEIYHLAGHSKTADDVGFEELFQSNLMITTYLLKGMEEICPKARFFNASSAYVFSPQNRAINELDPIFPASAYGISKASALFLANFYKNNKGLYISNAFLFNHESPYRDSFFVTSKLCQKACELASGKIPFIELGDINVVRDWGHAEEFVESFWKMLQLESPLDFVLATGKARALKELVQIVLERCGIKYDWVKKNDHSDVLVVDANGKAIVKSQTGLIRKNDYPYLVGDISKAKKLLGHNPQKGLEEIVDNWFKFHKR